MRISKIAAAGALAVLGLGFAAPPKADAAFIMYLYQDGGNVVATGSGSLDLTDLSLTDPNDNNTHFIGPKFALIFTGLGDLDLYGSISGPSNFGIGPRSSESSETGDGVGVSGNLLAVPTGYVSGTTLTSSATLDGRTLANMRATPGTYTWTWGTGLNADSFTLDVLNVGSLPPTGAPEPASLLLLGTGVAALGLRRRRVTQASRD